MDEDLDNDPVLQKYKFPDPNSVNSDKKRLAAINEKIRSEKASKELIKTALSGQVLNKKIVFNKPDPPKKVIKEGPKCEREPKPKPKPEPEPSPMSKKLFDDDDGLDGNESFKLDIPSKRFQNSKGSKLIELQSRFAHDPRFKIDDKFIEDDEGEHNEEEEEGEEDNLKKETEKEMDILEEILGKPLKRKAKHSEDKQLTSSIIIPRYDPSKPESQKFKIRKVDKLEPYQLPDENDEEASDRPEVSKERFYEISETFKKDFPDDQNDGQSFSLTAMFGRPVADIPEANDKLGAVKSKGAKARHHSDNNEDTRRSKKKVSKLEPSKRSKSKRDSDDEDEDEDEDENEDENDQEASDFDESAEEEEPKSKKGKKTNEKSTKKDKDDSQSIKSNKSKVSNPLLKYERFCFTENDDRLTTNTFYDVDRIKKHMNSWKEKKNVMTTALTKKRRHFKHVSKLKSALESGEAKDKDLRTKYRIYKETTKKH